MRSALTRDNRKHRTSFRLESLEGRELLSAARPAAVAAEVARAHNGAPITVINGHVGGTSATSPLYFKIPGVFNGYSGRGSATPIGRVNFGGLHIPVPTNAAGTSLQLAAGSGMLTTSRGEKIYVIYTGTATVTTHGNGTFALNGTVVSGTGRFDGITGNFAANGVVNGHHVSFSFTLVPTYPTA